MSMHNAHDHIVDRLSDYIDGELDAQALAEVEQHLAGCGDCRTVATELRAVAARAAALVDTPPQQDLWSGVAARIGSRPPIVASIKERARRRFSFTLPQLAAASVALMMLVGRNGLARAVRRSAGGLPGRNGRRRGPAGNCAGATVRDALTKELSRISKRSSSAAARSSTAKRYAFSSRT